MAKYWTKPRIVFFTWGMVELVGWLATHFWPDPRVNWVWLVLIVIGLVPMVKYMSLKVAKLKNIMVLWVAAMTVGMVASFGSFVWPWLYWLGTYLGGFWLILMGAAFVVNALWWTPKTFLIGGAVQIIAGIAVFVSIPLMTYQYLLATVVGSGAMFLLMVKRGAR
ncbi:MAG: hypothetical protein WCY01_03685 [Alkalispirochaeta sp.]|jgi:hypothetical protein